MQRTQRWSRPARRRRALSKQNSAERFSPCVSNLPCLKCWSLLLFYCKVFPLLEKETASRGKRPNGAFEKNESGRCEAGLAGIPHGTAELAAAAVSCDIGPCLQPGTEALDVVVEKSVVNFLAWHGFFVLWLGFSPLCVADLSPPLPGVLTGAANGGQISVQAKYTVASSSRLSETAK